MILNRNDQVAIGTTAVLVSQPAYTGGERIFWLYTNVSTSGQIITLAVNDIPVANSGIVLYPGGSYGETKDARTDCTQDPIRAIASAASGVLAVAERRN